MIADPPGDRVRQTAGKRLITHRRKRRFVLLLETFQKRGSPLFRPVLAWPILLGQRGVDHAANVRPA